MVILITSPLCPLKITTLRVKRWWIFVSGAEENFQIRLRLSDANIGTSGVGSDTLALAAMTPTITPASVTKSGLLIGASLTIGGTVSVTIPTASCTSVRYLCAQSMPTSGAYKEGTTVTQNNWFCKDITMQISCAVGESSWCLHCTWEGHSI